MFLFTALALGSQLALVQPTLVADEVPRLNVEPGCRAVATGNAGTQRDIKSCMTDENNAKDALNKEWRQFSAADRQRCTDLARMGGEPSYVQLYECLDIARETTKESSSQSTGQGTTNQPVRSPPAAMKTQPKP